MELKNQFTGQSVQNAKWQYIEDRDPKELLFQFKKRALVHFAVDTDEVYMTTRIDGKRTKYLSFNLGNNKGAGNPYLSQIIPFQDVRLENFLFMGDFYLPSYQKQI